MNPARLQTIVERMLAMLFEHHSGSQCGIKAGALARSLSCSERELRFAVQAARESGTYIAATPGTGYYMPVTSAEIEHASSFLFSRAMASLKQVAAMKQIGLHAALKQMEMKL